MANIKNLIVRKVLKSYKESKGTDDETNKIYNKLVDKKWLSTEKPPGFDMSGWSADRQAWHNINDIVKKVRRKK